MSSDKSKGNDMPTDNNIISSSSANLFSKVFQRYVSRFQNRLWLEKNV
jgi:hypothetical protein